MIKVDYQFASGLGDRLSHGPQTRGMLGVCLLPDLKNPITIFITE